MKPKMVHQENEKQERVSQEIQAAFDTVTCNDDLKQRTRSYVLYEMNCRRRALPRRIKWGVSVACFLLFLSGGLGGYQLYYTEAATISIDVNPSIELEVNRWGKVVDEKTYGSDSEEVLSAVSLKHLEYEEALERLLGSEAMKKYLSSDSVVTITVDNRANDERLMTNLQACVDSALDLHHDGVTAEYASVDGHMCQEAHSHGMSVGKYNAIKELMEEDPEATVDEFKDQSMKEIKMHMEHCEHAEGSQERIGCDSSSSGGEGSGTEGFGAEGSQPDNSRQKMGGCSQHDSCPGGHHSQ